MNKKLSKVVSLLLSLIMVVSIMPVSALADVFDFDETVDTYYNVISKADYEIAPGINESEIVLNNDDGSRRQVLHFMEADISNPYTKVISSYTEMNTENYQVSNMMDQATWIEENWGWNVVGAMNTCLSWYNTDYYLKEHPELINEPLGFMMVDGVIMNDEAVGFPTVLVIHYDEKDGETRPTDIPKVEMRTVKTTDDLNGWEEQIIPCSSGFILKDGVIQSTESHSGNDAPRSVVGIKEDGTVVIMMNDGRQSPYSAGMTMYEIAAAMKAAGCIHAVNCDGGGSSTFLSQRPGEELAVNCSPSDGALRSTTQGIVFVSTAPATGEFVRANITTENEYYTPGSTVTFDALGTDLVGTTATIPEDVSWQLKEEGMGTITDGVFTSNGTVGTVTAQMVYNGNVVGEASVEIVIPETLEFAQSVMTVPFDKEVDVALKATVNGGIHEVVLKPSDITFSITNEALGTFDGFTFKSVSESEAPEDLTSTLTATLNYGEGLSATASFNLGKGSEVLFDFEENIDGWNVGDVNQTSGYTVKYDYNISHATATDGEVHDGNGSLHFYMNGLNQPNNAGSYKQLALYPDKDIIIENAKSIGAWVYVPDEFYNLWIRFHYYYEGTDGTYTKKNTVPVFNQPSVYNSVNESGWYYFSVDVSAYDSIMLKGASGVYSDAKNCRFIEFNQCHMATNDIWTQLNGTLNGQYNIYVDSICVDYSDAVDDREAPVFSSVALVNNESETALENHTITNTTNNTINVMATVAEDTTKTNSTGLDAASAKAYIDGVEVDCTYNNGKISISDISVADGVHRIKFEISDMMGNKSVVIRLIEVESGVDASTIEVVPADSTLDKLLGGSVYWMNMNATDIETIKSVSTVIDLNSSNHWELDHMELADGFTSEYKIDEETNTATITITRTGENTQTGNVTLAALPVRVIYYDTDINLEGYTAETYWNDYNFWSHDLKFDVDMGQITYVDGYNSSVLNTFSNEEFSVDTEWYTSGLKTDATHKSEKGTSHVHTATALEDKAATCTEDGYTGRTFCEVCNSVVEWGTTVTATGHEYKDVDGILKCECGELFNGKKDGKTYVDGIVLNGWVGESYYDENGNALTGSHFLNDKDGGNGKKMYTFDEAGVYNPDYLYEGFYEIDDTVMYFSANNYLTGSHRIGGAYYNFDVNGLGWDGEYVIDGTTCVFDDGLFIPTENIRQAGICGENATFIQYLDKVVICGSGAMMDYTTAGNVPWYADRHYTTTVEIGENITVIGQRAFNSHHNLTEVIFKGTNVKTLKYCSFSRCYKLETLILPEGLETIEDGALCYIEGLKSVYIPASVTKIGGYAFGESESNLTLQVQEGSYGLIFANYKGINVEIRQAPTDVSASGTCGENINWELNNKGVLTLSGTGAMPDYQYAKYNPDAAPWAIYRDSITKVVIGDGIESIGAFAFYECKNLAEVVFEGDDLTYIGNGAFGYINALKSITLPASLKTIGTHAFYYSGLETVDFAEGSILSKIDNYAFRNCTSLKKVYIPDPVQSIGGGSFYAVTDVTLQVADTSYAHNYAISKGIAVEIRNYLPVVIYSGTCGDSIAWELYDNGELVLAGTGIVPDYQYSKYNQNAAPWRLYRDKITKVVIGDGIESIGAFAFYECKNLAEVVFEGDDLTYIGNGAFGYINALKSITLPASLKTIGTHAFYYSGLETVDFAEGSNLTVIDNYAFRNCTELKTVYIPETVESIGGGSFYSVSGVTLQVKEGSYAHDYSISKGISVSVR